MAAEIPPSPEALEEALALSEEILKDLELSRVPLWNAALKAGRLARLLNHEKAQQIFQFEASGYPSTQWGDSRDMGIAKNGWANISPNKKNGNRKFL